MSIPPLQRVPGLLKTLLDDRIRASRTAKKNSGAEAQTAREDYEPTSLHDELARLMRNIDAGDSAQVARMKPAVVETVLRHELGRQFLTDAEISQASNRIEQAISSTLGDEAWSQMIRAIQTRSAGL